MKLCDVARVFDVTSRDFSCILPAVLLQNRMHKRVKCFSKEFRSLMRLDPQGDGNCGKGIGNQSWEVHAPTNSCASLSSGNQVLGFSVGERILDVAEDIEGRSGSSDKQVLRMPCCEGMKVSSVEGTACVPLNLGEVQHCSETADYESEGSSVAEVQEVKAAPVRRVPPLLLRRVHACNRFSSPQCFKHVDSPDNFTIIEAGPNDNCLVENDGSEGEVDSSDRFSCQRTTAYMAWPRLSCARTYRSWPFPRHGPPSEIKALIRTGPRWIVTTEASEGTENMINNMRIDFNASSECTVGHKAKENLIAFEPHDGSVVVQNSHGQVQSTAQSARVLASPNIEETSKDQSEFRKNPGKALTSFSSVQENDSQAVNICFSSVMNSDTRSVDLEDSLMKRTDSSMSRKCLEDNESGTEAATFRLPDPLPDLQQSAFQALPCIMHSREEPGTPTVMVPSNVEPKQPSSVLVHPEEEPKSDTDIGQRSPCSLSDPHTKTAVQNTSSETYTGSSGWDTPLKSMTSSDSFSSGEEDISSLSPAEKLEKGDTKILPLQYEMCETGKAKSPSPIPTPASSVVTSGDLDVVRAYEDDAIVLDVIQDDPDLFGAIVMATGNSASQANPDAVQRGKNMCMRTNQTNLVRKPNRIVWDVKSGRYVGVYKQAQLLYFMNVIF